MFATSKSADAVYLAGGDGVADAIDFDGSNDYLSRASDLTGNTDGKTFTFSYFGWRNATGSLHTIYDNGKVTIQVNSSDQVIITGKNAAGTTILSATATASTIQKQTFYNLLISIDLTNTSNRSTYIDDVAATVTWAAYTNDTLDWTTATHAVGAVYSGFASKYAGRLSGLFLDYAYRNLSVEATRRLFITADRKPAKNQQTLNPIIYLSLSDQTQPGLNLGTGGNFTLTGVVAKSGRGPSQFNATYSDLDGSADYLSRSSITGLADSKLVTFSCCFNLDTSPGNSFLIYSESITLGSPSFYVNVNSSNAILLRGQVAGGGTVLLSATSSNGVVSLGRNNTLVVSIDLSDTAKRYVYLNGSLISMTWTTYIDQALDFVPASGTYQFSIGGQGASAVFDGRLGNIFFDAKYIDLSQSTNLAKFVTGTGIDAKPVDLGANGEKPFGTPPLIYLPMYGNNAGKNYGSGGDFTVNSGPFAGARGPNEFWGNKADFDGSTGYLARTSTLAGVSDGKVASVSFKFRADTVVDNTYSIFSINTLGFTIALDTTSTDRIRVYASNGMDFYVYPAAYFLVNTDYFIQLCIDRSDYSKTLCYIDGVAATKSGSHTDTNTLYSSASVAIGSRSDSTYKFDGKLSEFYFATDYIDFSQEVNRLKFRDAFGNTVDLAPQIKAGTLPNPAIYMRFDPANQGKNYGTGGDFVKSGTILDGGNL